MDINTLQIAKNLEKQIIDKKECLDALDLGLYPDNMWLESLRFRDPELLEIVINAIKEYETIKLKELMTKLEEL